MADAFHDSLAQLLPANSHDEDESARQFGHDRSGERRAHQLRATSKSGDEGDKGTWRSQRIHEVDGIQAQAGPGDELDQGHGVGRHQVLSGQGARLLARSRPEHRLFVPGRAAEASYRPAISN